MEPCKTIKVQEGLLCAVGFLLTRWVVSRLANSKIRRTSSPLPPSPPRLPLIGNLLVLRKDMREVFRKLSNEYGGIFALHVGPKLLVVICGVEAMKEAFLIHGDTFADRAIPPLLRYAIGVEGSFAFDNGRVWKARRRFGLSAMRSFGVGKRSMEHRITEEARILCETIENNQSVGFNPTRLVTNAVANIICSISFGFRYEYNDPVFEKLILKIHPVTSSISFFSIGHLLPVLLHTPLYSNFRNLIFSIKSMVQRIVSDHGQTVDERDVRDIIDLYILEIRRQRERGDEIVFDEDRAWRGIFDLFVGGTGTTSSTLLWAILLMAKFPEAMKQVHEEIDRVVGDHRSPSMSDQEAMPLTTATIMEIQRFRPVTPQGVPRFTNQDVEVLGYHIPKGTAIIMHLWELLQSPKYWDEPQEFNPYRFLSEDRKTVLKPEAFLPFGIGQRVCMGELLAKMELFLMFSNLLQRFSFQLDDDSRDVGLEGRSGFVFVPHDYNIRAEAR